MTSGTPEIIGSFKILSKLGEGGMGAVYRAVHATLERPVALKILPPQFATNSEYITRFLREARTLATMRHENVVQVYDAGEQNGQYFIAMEMVDGCSLLGYLEKKREISIEEGLSLLIQAAKGLGAAHAKGLIHRDIKPENLLLGTDNLLRIVDFGLVMEATTTTQLTATGAFLGTPMYMSPEQADGEIADVRTDIYSLGVTFYHVFTGKPPFSSPTVMNLLFKHKFEAPPNPKTVRPDLSDDASNLLLHLMAKKREDRPQTAQAIVDMIEGLKAGRRIPPASKYVSAIGTPDVASTVPAQAPEPATSHKPGLLKFLYPVAACTVILALVGAGLFFSQREKHPDQTTMNAPSASGEQVTSSANAVEPDISRSPASDETASTNELIQKASAAEKAGSFDIAADLYVQASNISKGAEQEILAGKARECRRQYFIAQGTAADASSDFDLAVKAYSQALEIKTDPLVADRLEAARKKATQRASAQDMDRHFQQALRSGDEAMNAGNFAQARSRFGIALGLKPESPEVENRLKELDRQEFSAKQNSTAEVRKNIEALVRAERDAAAMEALTISLRTDPANADLKGLKAALENLAQSQRIYAELKASADAAAEKASSAEDIDDDGAFTGHRRVFRETASSSAEKSKKFRSEFLEGNHTALSSAITTARSDAKALSATIASAAATCDRCAEKASEKKSIGVNIPIIGGRAEVRRGSAKADEYRKIAESLRRLESSVKKLQE